MEKRNLVISGDHSSFLASYFDTNTRNYSYTTETNKSKVQIGVGRYLDDKPDIEFAPKFLLRGTHGFHLLGDETCKYRLQIQNKMDDKENCGINVDHKLTDTVLGIPTEWFNFSFDNTLHVMAERLLNKWKHMPFPEDVEVNNEGKPYFILRPTNLTHAILAFKVLDPKAFRFPLFRMILTELKIIHNARKENKVSDRELEHIRKRMLDCGLEPISETTFGIDGAYADKSEHEVYSWGLSLCIKGHDYRAIKAGKKHYLHLGYHSSNKEVFVGSTIRNPVEIDTMYPNNPEIGKDIARFMDNEYTLIDGALDLRHPLETNRFYFMETSFSFSTECYTEDFIRQSISNVLEFMEEKYDEMVGNKNDDLDYRLSKYYAQMQMEKEKALEGETVVKKDVDLTES